MQFALESRSMIDVSHVLIMKDFNVPLISSSSWTCCINSENCFYNTSFNCLRNSFFHQHVTIPIRSRYNQNPSILDLILTNEEGTISSLSHLSPLGKSDHSILFPLLHTTQNTIQLQRMRLLYNDSTIEI